jgi:branched-subunit amino acid aminotransferase/4-amino-4-deoxychorismate lyase
VASHEVFRIEIDTRPPTLEALQQIALDNGGHFTAMQVRNAAVRGLDAHLTRLDEGSRELFGVGLDGGRVRWAARHALRDVKDASLRVMVYESHISGELWVMVTLRPRGGVSDRAQALQSVEYQRTLPHVKHLGGFGQAHHARMARHAGFDDALLTDHEGVISESSIANVAFMLDDELVWPDAPALRGITMQMIEPRLVAAGIPTRRRQVTLADIPRCQAAFVTNARGIAPVDRVDHAEIPLDTALTARLKQVYADVSWDAL